MKKLLRIAFSVAIISSMACGCNETKTYQRLVLIDSLVYNDFDDSAKVEMSKIDIDDIKGESDMAYYDLLKTQILFRQDIVIENDSMIDRSIAFYEKDGDMRKLTMAYYFKGRNMYNRGDVKSGLLYLKKAEYAAKDIDDYLLIARIYMSLGVYNMRAGEYVMCVKHCKKALDYSERCGSKEDMLFCLNNIATAYSYLDDEDSLTLYQERCIPLLDAVPEIERVVILANLSTLYANSNLELAKDYARKAIAIKPVDTAYFLLAAAAGHEGDRATADSCWAKALELSSNLYKKIIILEHYFRYLQKCGKYAEAAEITNELIALHDSLTMKQRQDSIMGVQILYEMDMYRKTAENRQNYTYIFMSVLAAVLLFAVIYHIVRRRKTKSALDSNRRQMEKYAKEMEVLGKKISKLEKDKDNRSKQVAELKRRLKAVQERHEKAQEEHLRNFEKMMVTGRSLYDMILDGRGTTVKWSKEDMACFTEYYITVNKDFASGINSGYRDLTDSQKMYLILTDMDFANERICEVMCIKPDSLRMMKKRIADKSIAHTSSFR